MPPARAACIRLTCCCVATTTGRPRCAARRGATVYDEAAADMTGGSEQPLPAASPPHRLAAGPPVTPGSARARRTYVPGAVTPDYTGCRRPAGSAGREAGAIVTARQHADQAPFQHASSPDRRTVSMRLPGIRPGSEACVKGARSADRSDGAYTDGLTRAGPRRQRRRRCSASRDRCSPGTAGCRGRLALVVSLSGSGTVAGVREQADAVAQRVQCRVEAGRVRPGPGPDGRRTAASRRTPRGRSQAVTTRSSRCRTPLICRGSGTCAAARRRSRRVDRGGRMGAGDASGTWPDAEAVQRVMNGRHRAREIHRLTLEFRSLGERHGPAGAQTRLDHRRDGCHDQSG